MFLVLFIPCQAAWQLAWSDEFAQADGSSPDSSKWGYDIGASGWGNAELEYYTARTNNARIEGGQLVIEARKETYNGSDYTSARMLTKGKWSWTYGRIEARIKIPRGQGIWPAFWMLGVNIDSVGWPNCGEIDIMENIGNFNDRGTTHGTIHGPGYSGGGSIGGTYTLPGGAALADDFHIYAVEWTPNQFRWFLDTNLYFTATPASLPGGTVWVFTQPQFLLLNVAVGGYWPGYPDGTTVFPQQMRVDYVRVYTNVPSIPDTPTGLAVSPGNAKVFLSWDASSTGATSYNVKRSTTSGGAYATIGITTSSSFTDTAVNNCSTYYYVVSAANSLGESTNTIEQPAELGAFALAVNCGGGAAGQFGADAYAAGGTQATPVTATIDTSDVVSPAPQAVYQSERYGNFTYTLTNLTPGQNYKLRLHFAETYWSGVGQRLFNVLINGAQVLTNFDIIAVTGAKNKATVREFTVPANSGQIVVQYATVTDNAKSSGIEILIPRTASPTADNNGPIWSGMTLNLTASTVPGATYTWTGPNGFASTNQNPSIINVSTNYSGLFSVTMAVGGCLSVPGTTMVTVNPPARVAGQFSAGNIILDWPGGILQSATNLDGPWSDVSGATSPLTNPAVQPQEFYRLKLQ